MMIQNGLILACVFAVLGTGLVAGVFLTFSDFVMKALASVSAASGIEAMQMINRKVYGSVFLVLLIGMAVFDLLLSGYAYFQASVFLTDSVAALIIAGSVIYLIGVFLVTILLNVPMNMRLDTMDANTEDATVYWRNYLQSWTLWNNVRTVASLVAAACFSVAVI